MPTVSFELMDIEGLRGLRKPPSIKQGIYFLWADEEIVYIGQSINLSVRIWQHLTRPEHNLRDEKITGISVIEVEEGQGLDLMESLYINAYKPRRNKAKMK